MSASTPHSCVADIEPRDRLTMLRTGFAVVLFLAAAFVSENAHADEVTTYAVCYISQGFQANSGPLITEPFIVMEDSADRRMFDGVLSDSFVGDLEAERGSSLVHMVAGEIAQGYEGTNFKAGRVSSQFSDTAHKYSPYINGWNCWQFITEAAARAMIAKTGYGRLQLPGWPPTGPHIRPGKKTGSTPKLPAVSKPAPQKPARSASSPYLVVEAVVPPVDPNWDKKVRESQKKQADDRAKALALTAANDAKMKADLAETLRKLKAKGSSQ